MWLKIKKFKWALALLVAFGMTACTRVDFRKSTLEVRLTDAPGDYQEVNIDIQDVQINQSNDDSGWTSIDVPNKGIYNLLELTNGIDTLLGTYTLPAGTISQIRLVLGPNNSIKVNDNIYNLNTPSAQQCGLKINLQATLAEGINYRVILDFDAGKSIVARGNDTYSLKPVIRAMSEATNGAITGTISPVESSPAVYAINGTDTVASTFSNQEGKFLLSALPAATYQVHFAPKTGYSPKEIADVIVVNGSVNDLGTVTIQ
jgi:hypothetical protein